MKKAFVVLFVGCAMLFAAKAAQAAKSLQDSLIFLCLSDTNYNIVVPGRPMQLKLYVCTPEQLVNFKVITMYTEDHIAGGEVFAAYAANPAGGGETVARVRYRKYASGYDWVDWIWVPSPNLDWSNYRNLKLQIYPLQNTDCLTIKISDNKGILYEASPGALTPNVWNTVTISLEGKERSAINSIDFYLYLGNAQVPVGNTVTFYFRNMRLYDIINPAIPSVFDIVNNRNCSMKYDVTGYFGAKAASGSSQFVFSDTPPLITANVTFTETGFYWANLSAVVCNESVFKRFGLGAIPARAAIFDTYTMFAVNAGSQDTNLMVRAGIRSTRDGISWGSVEPNKGSFDWASTDVMVNALYNAKIQVMPCLGFPPVWASRIPPGYQPITEGVHVGWECYPPNSLDEWGNYVYQTVNRYKSKIRSWEIWNEPWPNGLFFTGGTIQDYVDVLVRAYNEAKAADPTCTVIGLGGTEYVHMTDVFNAGGYPYMDSASIHHYQPGPQSPDMRSSGKYIYQTDKANLIADSWGGKQLWMTEMGWPTNITDFTAPQYSDNWEGISEELQAQYLARTYTRGYDLRLKRIFWFTYMNGGGDPKNFEHNQGLLYMSKTPKPSYIAYATLTRMLEGLDYSEKLSSAAFGDTVVIIKFIKGNTSCFAIWSPLDTIVLKCDSVPATVIDMMGSVNTLAYTGGKYEISATENMLYLYSTINNSEAIKNYLLGAQVVRRAGNACSYLRASKPVTTADGVDVCTVTIAVISETGIPMGGRQVTLYSSRDTTVDTITQPAALTNGQGICTATIRSSAAGNAILSAVSSNGISIQENMVLNASFETTVLTNNWTLINGTQVTGISYNGIRSLQTLAASANRDGAQSPYINITNDSVTLYEISACMRTTLMVTPAYYLVVQFFTAVGVTEINHFDVAYFDTNTEWVRVSSTYGGTGANAKFTFPSDCARIRILAGRFWHPNSNPNGRGWTDCVTMRRLPTVTFGRVETKLRITTLPFVIAQSNPSPLITVEMQDTNSIKDFTFSDTILLTSTSAGGRFSLTNTPWVNTTSFKLMNGARNFYYKDTNIGNPVITVSRAGVKSDSQPERIVSGAVCETTTYFLITEPKILANGVIKCTVTISLRNILGCALAEKVVTVSTSRGSVIDTIAQPGITYIDGRCSGTIRSSTPGGDTVYANCEGLQMLENAVINPSFEEDFTGWAAGTSSIDSIAYSGEKSQRLIAVNQSVGGAFSAQFISISNDSSVYQVSAYYRATRTAGNYYFSLFYYDANNAACSPDHTDIGVLSVTTGWTRVLQTFGGNGSGATVTFPVNCAKVKIRAGAWWDVSTGTGWTDCIRMRRLPTITFVYPTKLKIKSSAFDIPRNNASPAVIVEAQDDSGVKITQFSGTMTLTASSGTGNFSLSNTAWINTGAAFIISGSGLFYFKDSSVGTPVITVARAGLKSDTQVEKVHTDAPGETASSTSYLRVNAFDVLADGVSRCTVTVCVKDIYGNALSGNTVTISTNRGSIIDTVAQPALTDTWGMCTGTIRSSTDGGDTVYAWCQGSQVLENLVLNPSFENGSSDWALGSSTIADTGYTGSKSACLFTPGGNNEGAMPADFIPVLNSSSCLYEVAAYIKATVITGTFYFSLFCYDSGGSYIIHTDIAWFDVNYDWTRFSQTFGGTGSGAGVILPVNCVKVKVRAGAWWNGSGNPSGTGWTDTIRIKRIPTIRFQKPSRLKIMTSALDIPVNNVSPAVVIEVQNDSGAKVSLFSGTVTLSASSPGGSFSLDKYDWVNTTIIYISAGTASFYYKDTNIGTSVVTVFRAGIKADSQTEVVSSAAASCTSSYISTSDTSVKANGTDSITVFVIVRTVNGCALSNKTVTLCAVRGNSTAISVNPQATDVDGKCTFAISSVYVGTDTLTALCDGNTIGKPVFPGLVGGYFFDRRDTSSIEDISGTGNAGVFNGTYYDTTITNGKLGRAIWLNGADNNISVADTASLNLVNAVTLMYWIKASGVNGQWQNAATKWGADRNYGTYFDVGAGNLAFSASYVGSPNAFDDVGSGWSAWDNQWHHVAAFFDGSAQRVKIYIDGAERANSFMGYSQLRTTASSFLIGTGTPGIFDDVKVYSRALGYDEIRADFLANSIIKFTTPGVAQMKITSSTFTVPVNNPSQEIIVEAQDTTGLIVSGFTDTVTLTSSSASGKFSLDKYNWQDTTFIYMIAGSAIFYYKDSTPGNPLITVSRLDVKSDSQPEMVIAGGSASSTQSFITVSPFSTKATGSDSINVFVNVQDSNGFWVQGRMITLYTQRGTVFTQVSANPQVSDADGRCTFTISSQYCGSDTLIARCDGGTVSKPVTEGLVAGYLFDRAETVSIRDISQSVNAAAFTGTYFDTTVAQGILGNGIWFSGTDDIISIPENSSLDLPDAVTIILWLKASGNNGLWQNVIQKWDGTDRNYGMHLNIGDGTLSFSTSFVGGIPWTDSNCGWSAWDNQWHHIAAQFDGSTQRVKVYTDAIERLNTNVGYSQMKTNPDPVRIGKSFPGLVDEVKIYNRALTYDEIRADFLKSSVAMFTSTILKFAAPLSTATLNCPSPMIIVRAQDGSGNVDYLFNDTAILTAGSATGKFSIDRVSWADTTVVQLSAGQGFFYYADSSAGSFVITASRDLFSSDTQTVNVVNQSVNATASYISFSPYMVPADGISVCTVTVTINDTYGFPIQAKTVTLQTNRGAQDTITGNPGTTDAEGRCTFTVRSSSSGWDTVSARCDGLTVTKGVNRDNVSAVWHLDTDVLDSSGNGNAGTLNGPGWVQARFGSGLYFDGINDYALVQKNLTLVPSANRISVECWVNPSGITGAAQHPAAKWNNYYLRLSADLNTITFAVFLGASEVQVSAANTFNTGVWYHIAGVYDGETSCVYVNGALKKAEYKGIAINTDNSYDLHIGSASWSAAQFFKGVADEVRIYNRAVSAKEVYDSYKGFCVMRFSPTQPSKFEIITSPFTAYRGTSSPMIYVEAWDTEGYKVSSFNNTAGLSSSSAGGRFSIDKTPWQNTSSVLFAAGSATFYYKDIVSNSPVITVSRPGLRADSQTENIIPIYAWDTTSYLMIDTAAIPADGVSACTVTILVRSQNGLPIMGSQATIYSARGPALDTIIQPGVTDDNGQCTGRIISAYAGADTVYAICEGCTILENLFLNPSFEEDTSGWSTWATGQRVSDIFYSGVVSERVIATGAANMEGAWSNYALVDVSPLAVFRVSYHYKTDMITGNYFISFCYYDSGLIPLPDPAFPANDHWDITSEWLTVDWTEKSMTFGGLGSGAEHQFPDACVYTRLRDIWWNGANNPAGTAWFDAVRLERIPMINFMSSRLKFASQAFTTTVNNPSTPVVIEARGLAEARDDGFNGTVTLMTSSAGGAFSVDYLTWADTNIVTLSGGQVIVYYRDSNPGTPMITVYREGLAIDTQRETILAVSTSETASYLRVSPSRIPSDGASLCSVIVTINDACGFPVSGRTVTLATSRGASFDTVSANPQVSDANGICTFTIRSSRAGNDTVTARCDGVTVTENIIQNPGFEEGVAGLSAWYKNGDDTEHLLDRVSDAHYSGGKSVRAVALTGGSWFKCQQDVLPAEGNANYIFSAFIRGDSISSGASVGFWIHQLDSSYTLIFLGVNATTGSTGTFNWVKVSNSFTTLPATAYFNVMTSLYGTGTAWYDDARLQRLPTINFTATGLKIRTSPFSVPALTASPAIVVAAVDSFGNTDVSFYDTVLLLSSSAAGFFSVDNIVWVNTTNIYLSAGSATYYYKDANTGNPVITAYRESLIADTQTETITSAGAGYLGIITAQFRIRAADPSPMITCVAYDSGGNTDSGFNNTVTLTTSSNSGSFSASSTTWANTTNITFTAGFGWFSYRDNFVGWPTVTVTRYSLLGDSQTETVTLKTLQITNTPGFTITSISTAPIMVRARDGMGNTAVNCTDSVTLQSSSLKGKFSLSGTLWSDTTSVHLSAGSVVIFYKDKTGGNPVVTVTRVDSWTWRDTQSETVTKPVVSTSKVQMNMRSGETGSMPMRFWKTDTVEYTIYIQNTGTETATGNMVVDTKSFDTSTNNAVDYVYMDTVGFADTWAYTTDPTFTVWTTGNPASGASNIKGLRWTINSLGINASKAIKFRVRVK